MLRSARNPIECAFGRLKTRWQILNIGIDIGLVFVLCIVYACFVPHILCEIRMTIDDDTVARQVAHDRLQPEDAPNRLYSFNSAEVVHVRNTATLYYNDHIPH